MKTAVFVGLFVVVACLQLQAHGAEFSGRTKDCSKKPEGIENTCHRYTCNENAGQYTVQTCGVASVECPEGHVEEKGAEDLSKSYPDCCARPYCRSA